VDSRQDWPMKYLDGEREKIVLTSARGEVILSHTGEIV
jgi:hypothetical protein